MSTVTRDEPTTGHPARRPVLVTGVPRSGTTWLARLLASSPRTALAGREPMNPRGRQYALGGSLDGWARLTELSAPQRLRLRAAYGGWNPFVYSRYGTRQWAGPLPGTRLVVKDPYAMLSLAAVVGATHAVPVLLYRHPGAVLASYRRVGWQPRLDEVARIAAAEPELGLPEIPGPGEASPAEEMAVFWSMLHELALVDAAASAAVVVSHSELAAGGAAAGQALSARLGLVWTPAMAAELSRESGPASSGGAGESARLHDFDRAPAAVAEAWRTKLPAEETERVERVAGATLARVEAARLRLG